MIAFDTNVLLYAADVRDSRMQRIAIQTIRGARDGVVLWQAACEFVAASRKLVDYGLSSSAAWDILAEYLKAFPLVLPSAAVLERARILHVEQQWSFWDAMIVAACLEAGVMRLYSDDLPGRAPPSPLEIVNPFA